MLLTNHPGLHMPQAATSWASCLFVLTFTDCLRHMHRVATRFCCNPVVGLEQKIKLNCEICK
ncbi:hypothetical protein AWF80_002745 [Escherichia coli]|nr:hypothetical protein AWF80_002745 [Escherichia coli]TRY37339.1 hypothetical protein FNJ78_15430 [Escherichia coli]